VALCLVPAGLGFGLLNAPLLGDISREFDGPDRSMAIGLFNVAYFAGGALGSAVTAVLLDVFSEVRWMGFRFAIGALCLVASVTAIEAVVRARRRSA
jgi:MFS family permease